MEAYIFLLDPILLIKIEILSPYTFIQCYMFIRYLRVIQILILQINDFEKVTVRCVLFEQLPPGMIGAEVPPKGWEKRFYPALIPNQEDALKMLPRHPITPEDLSTLVDGKKILDEFSQWKSERDKRLFSS